LLTSGEEVNMSRIGRLPIEIPKGVNVSVNDNLVIVKGPLGELKTQVDKDIAVQVEDNQIILTRSSEDKRVRSMHGLYRALVANTVEGVTKGYTKELVIKGVGYKVSKQGKKIVLNIGFSHPVEVNEPEGVTIDVVNPTELAVKGIDKRAVGQCAADIKAIKKPDPYHQYGIRYKNEDVIKKEGKSGKK
jgi:large subunit ribosomal protein L6